MLRVSTTVEFLLSNICTKMNQPLVIPISAINTIIAKISIIYQVKIRNIFKVQNKRSVSNNRQLNNLNCLLKINNVKIHQSEASKILYIADCNVLRNAILPKSLVEEAKPNDAFNILSA
uniref:PINc domain-containing protein n=1 Tax=Strongyloides venezuelensis TaxID=75913 RepID=A0A0K0G5F6_STRVS